MRYRKSLLGFIAVILVGLKYIRLWGAAFLIPNTDPVVRVIYHDSISCFTWDVKSTANNGK